MCSLSKKIRKALMAVLLLMMVCAVPSEAAAGEIVDVAEHEGYIYKYSTTYPFYHVSPHKFSYGYYQSGSAAMFTLIKSKDVAFEWEPSDGYDIAYCCDLSTETKDGTYYKRVNLENSSYFDAFTARKIRNVVVNGYPNQTTAQIKTAANNWLKKTNSNKAFKGTVDDAQAMTATQFAIWDLANPDIAGSKLNYSGTEDIYWAWQNKTIAPFTGYSSTDISNNVNIIRSYLKSTGEKEVEEGNVLVGHVEVTANLNKNADTGKYILTGDINCYNSNKTGKIKTKISSNSAVIKMSVNQKEVLRGTIDALMSSGVIKYDEASKTYSYCIENLTINKASNNVKVKMELSGEQEAPKGAYFYTTVEGQAGSQNFVGIAEGTTPMNVSAETETKVLHSLSKVDGKEETCSEEGQKEHYLCSTCGKTFKDKNGTEEVSEEEIVIPAKKHDWGEWTEESVPTCTEDGLEKRVCKNDTSHEETNVLTSPGHSLSKVDGKEETCTEAGQEEHYLCSTCGKTFKDENGTEEVSEEELVIPAKKHDWGEWTEESAPTCTEDGLEKRVCKNDTSHEETNIIPATGEEARNPITGDRDMSIWFVMMIMSIVAATVTLRRRGA